MAKNDIDPIVGIIFLIAMAFAFSSTVFYFIAITLQPIFIALTFAAGIGIILFGFIWYQDQENSMAIGFAVSLLILFISISGWAVTGDIIKEVTDSPEAQEQIELVSEVVGIPETIYATFDVALRQEIDELCKTTDQNTCDLMKVTVKNTEDLMEIRKMISQGKKYADIAKKAEQYSRN
jgi:ABC-type transport system involved in multi-copper enzyme maturation permease subunit